jgi:Domain of unknown function (DUF2760)
MSRITLAFQILFDGQFAQKIRGLIDAQPPSAPTAAEPEEAPAPQPAPPPKPKGRNDALTLLATLQREARLVDFLLETLDGYSDAQVGAAVRDVHRDSRTVLERLFAVQPVFDQAEGSSVKLDHQLDAGRVRLTGDVEQESPSRGTLMHHGWQATRCELPRWTGSEAAALVLAPAEVEVRNTSANP